MDTGAMSGDRRHTTPVGWAVRRARAGLVAMGRGVGLSALALAGLTPLAALLMLALMPCYGIWTAITVGTEQRFMHLPTGAVPRIFGGGFIRAVALFITALAIAVIPLAAPPLLAGVRQVSARVRTLSGRWAGVPVPSPSLPNPGRDPRPYWLLSDPATWRDLSWTVVNATVGVTLLLGPWIAASCGALTMLRGLLGLLGLTGLAGSAGPAATWLLLPGAALTVLGLWTAPVLLRLYGQLARSVLARPGTAELARRITHLAQTRAETIDASAAEIRRIERDLHDGAQARLVAIGMALDAAGQLLDTQPGAARELMTDARDNSARALAEIRGLVRGIHPPVLADRGLTDAVRALALDTPHPVSVRSDLAGRLPAPVESAAYFAVSELLANVVKHAGALEVSVRIGLAGGRLTVTVSDDGHGGADPAAGTGLRGIQRRLAAFDGMLTIDSPLGGPTEIILELPCAS